MPTMRRFTQGDWYGWAGAMPFANDDQPWIGEFTVTIEGTDLPAVLIADSQCIEVDCYDNAGETRGTWHCAYPSGVNALLVLLPLAAVTVEELVRLGFESI